MAAYQKEPIAMNIPLSSAQGQGTNESSHDPRPVVLRLDGIDLTVPDGQSQRHLLRGVSLSVRAGELVGIVGPSGSGKSTLLSIAGCLQDPDQGEAVLHCPGAVEPLRLRATGREAARLRREHIGIVFQQPNLLPALKVRQQLVLMSRLGGVLPPLSRARRKEIAARAEELLVAVGLEGLGERTPAQLSGGQQARVNIARALMNHPQLLLVDEPTAALDQQTAATITELIARITREHQVATLYITHDHEQLRGADRILQMTDGLLVSASGAAVDHSIG